jgi:hypothetical protein
MSSEELGALVGRIAGALLIAAILVWVFVYSRSRDTQRANRAALSWRTVLVGAILIVLLAAARVGEAQAGLALLRI